MVHVLPAAAIPEGSFVALTTAEDEEAVSFDIFHVQNSTPRPGKITWTDPNGEEIVMGGNERVEVLLFPHERD